MVIPALTDRTLESFRTGHDNCGAVFARTDPAVAVTLHAPRVRGGVAAEQRPVAAAFHPVRRTVFTR